MRYWLYGKLFPFNQGVDNILLNRKVFGAIHLPDIRFTNNFRTMVPCPIPDRDLPGCFLCICCAGSDKNKDKDKIKDKIKDKVEVKIEPREISGTYFIGKVKVGFVEYKFF
jgi:hypothetical protein